MMTDSGWEPHPYFVQRGYRFSSTVAAPGAANPAVDENGHGTAESANIFAVAPDVDFSMVKLNFANSTAGFNAAVAMNPHIISNSWGSDNKFGPLGAADLALAAAIATAVANGIIVVFSAGNGHWGYPGQHPDVISAGGVYLERDGSMRASNYSSGFVSNIFAGRQSPDLCGLVGMQPKAAYIMLPVPAGSAIDVGLAGSTHPNGDETQADDAWAAISGTSAAAPQIAGAAALIKQACPRLTPAEVKDVLQKTARDVTVGTSHPNTPGTTGTGTDTATGAGLLDAQSSLSNRSGQFNRSLRSSRLGRSNRSCQFNRFNRFGRSFRFSRSGQLDLSGPSDQVMLEPSKPRGRRLRVDSTELDSRRTMWRISSRSSSTRATSSVSDES
jgi:subtilisin family serine protease